MLRAAIVLCWLLPPSMASAAGADVLKAEIDGFLNQLLLSGNGLLKWDGADTIDVKDEGDGAVAVISNGRIAVRSAPDEQKPLATITLDRLEIHRKPAPQGGGLVEYDLALPSRSDIVNAAGDNAVLSLDNAKLTVIVEGEKHRQRSLKLAAGGARVDIVGNTGQVGVGAIEADWNLVPTDDGGWHAPGDMSLKNIVFQIPDVPIAGRIDRVTIGSDSKGPSIAALDAFRDQAAAVRETVAHDPDQVGAQYLDLMSKMLGAFSSQKGELTVEQLTAQRPGGEMLVTLKKATFGGVVDGLSGDAAAIRFTLSHDGLTLAPSLLPAAKVPHRAVLDFGIEEIDGKTLREIANVGARMGPAATDDEKQQAMTQLITLAMSLKPVLRVHHAAVDFANTGIDATAEARRAPPAPLGYAVTADIAVRNFDGLSDILSAPNDLAMAPLVKFIGDQGTNADGAPVLKFHLTTGLGQPFKVNGSDLSLWSAGGSATSHPHPADEPRVLRLAETPLTGDDVRAVQKALGTATIRPLKDGVYDSATALAVMRFQKDHGLNVDGVVDTPTRDKLGIASPPPGSKN